MNTVVMIEKFITPTSLIIYLFVVVSKWDGLDDV